MGLEVSRPPHSRIFHESPTTTSDMGILPGVLGSQLLRRTVQAGLESKTLRLPGGMPIFVVSRRRFMKYAGYAWIFF